MQLISSRVIAKHLIAILLLYMPDFDVAGYLIDFLTE